MKNSYKNFLNFLVARPGKAAVMLDDLKARAGDSLGLAKTLAETSEEVNSENLVRDTVGSDVWSNVMLRKLFVVLQPQLPAFYDETLRSEPGFVAPAGTVAALQPMTHADLADDRSDTSHRSFGGGNESVFGARSAFDDSHVGALPVSYLAFLQALVVKLTALGPLAPQLIVLIQRQVALFQEFVALLKGAKVFGEAPSLEFAGGITAEIQDAEGQVIALCNQPGLAAAKGDESFGRIGDGTLLRTIYALMTTYPELAKLLLSLLKL